MIKPKAQVPGGKFRLPVGLVVTVTSAAKGDTVTLEPFGVFIGRLAKMRAEPDTDVGTAA
jgi:hypothetical protein